MEVIDERKREILHNFMNTKYEEVKGYGKPINDTFMNNHLVTIIINIKVWVDNFVIAMRKEDSIMEKKIEERRLYLLVFMDANGPGCSSGLTEVYVDNIEEFSKNYQRAEQDRERVSRFLRSKAGEKVTDYYSDDPELGIVQRVDVSVIGQKRLSRDNATVMLENGFRWKAEYYFRSMTLDIMWIICNGSFIKLVKPLVRGGCEKNSFGDFPDKDHSWHRVFIHGNPFWINEAEPGTPDWSATPDAFESTRIESYVWHTAQVFEDEEEMKKDIRKKWLTPDQLIRTFMDLPGDAG